MMEIKYSKDKNSIKIWPYLDDITQCIIPYSDLHLSKTGNMVVNLDFSCVRTINSSGAAITLAKLISLLEGKEYLFKIVLPETKNKVAIETYMQKSCFLNILDQKIQFEKANLFESIEINKNEEVFSFEDSNHRVQKISFPIFHLIYDTNKDRASVEEFSDKVTDLLLKYIPKYKNLNVLITILQEIAKNSQDHTSNDAFIGIDIVTSLDTNNSFLVFSCADLGKGIYKNIKDFLKLNNNHLREDVDKHFSYTDAYKFAFTTGNTTSKKPRNKGIGMSMIMEGASMLNMDISIWDGRSMLLMPAFISHTELRRNSFDSSNKVGFYYFGTLMLNL